jgi:hypothetical protein
MGTRWHGCRAIDQIGDQIGGTIMYAEYPSGGNPRLPRVMRSRDRGRTWDVAFERTRKQIRHFHFLQARPGTNEWWLTAGDKPHESRIWVSRDDGDSWDDVTDTQGDIVSGGVTYPHNAFRLTDLVWNGDELIWGTDDDLLNVKGGEAGARVFRSPIKAPLEPSYAGRCRYHIRSMIEVGDFIVVLAAGANVETDDAVARLPGAYLMPKHAVPGNDELVHLLDIDVHSDKPRAGRGFTFSKASRAAVDGTFFSYRAPYHLFPLGHQILRWDVRFS